MALWERYSTGATVTGVGDHTDVEILHNEEDTDNFQNGDIVFVDGICTIITNTDDLVLVRLLILHELINATQILPGNPGADDRSNWYQFFAARGPLVFRLKSKKTLPPQHKLWIQVTKEQGTAATDVLTGIMLFEQLVH